MGAYDRRRGTAIVENRSGVVVVRQGSAPFLLPGGGVKTNELDIVAAIRELYEETGLVAYDARYVFTFHRSAVFLIRARGEPRPRGEISQVGYYTRGCGLRLSYNTIRLLERFYSGRENQNL